MRATKKIAAIKKGIGLYVICLLLTGCSDSTVETNSVEVNTIAETPTEEILEETDLVDETLTEINSTEELSTETNSVEEVLLDGYSIGDEIELGGVKFNVYKIDKNEDILHLITQKNIAITAFSDIEREMKYMHNYEGSLIAGYVNKFVDDFEDKGLIIQESGIIDKDDLIDLGFDIDGLNGTKYRIGDAPDFIEYEQNFWVDGYCKYDTYAWVYCNEILTTEKCEDEYGVRPVITISISELGKELQEVEEVLTIKEIVDSNCAWTSEGGIHNEYDRFYFDCENMKFIHTFESSEMSSTLEFGMEFVDDNTIRIEGFRTWYEIPTELTIVTNNKLRVRFEDDTYNDGDFYLNKGID